MNFPARIAQRRCLRRILPVRLRVDQFEDALGSGHRDERLVVLVADDRDGREELVREQEKRDQRRADDVAPIS